MDYPRVKIGSVYLTEDGLEDGMPCRCEVTGLERLKPSKTGSVVIAADGTPHSFLRSNTGKGAPISIRPYAVRKSVFDGVINAINEKLNTDEAVNITIEGDTGDFDLECVAALPQAVEFPGTFSDGIIDGVQFNFIVAGMN